MFLMVVQSEVSIWGSQQLVETYRSIAFSLNITDQSR